MGIRRKFMGLSLFLFLFWSFSTQASPQVCRFLFQKPPDFLATTPVGILQQTLTQEDLTKFRKQNDSFYNHSLRFSSDVGRKFVDLVRSRLPKSGKVVILVAMGGAEHLGTLLEYSLALKTIEGVEIKVHYIDMNSEILNPWEGTRSNNAQGFMIIRKGIGMPPEGYRMLRSPTDRGTFGRHFSPLAENLKIFDSDKVIVLDTGFRGTTVEAVNYISDSFDFDGPVEGVLLSHARGTENSVPIFSVNQTLKVADIITENWAFAIDENLTYGARPVLGEYRVRSFYRGGAVKVAKDNRALYAQRVERYQSTLAGLIDGLVP